MANTEDLFMKFTDSLLFIILSFLPLKEAAKTSVLSKRWNQVWHKMKIELDEGLFVKSQESDANKEIQRKGFLDVVRQRIKSYGDEEFVLSFGLTFSKPGDFPMDMQNCIAFATNHKAKGLSLDFSDPTWNDDVDVPKNQHATAFDLPRHVYSEGSIVEYLKLFGCNFIVSEFKSFSSLMHLSLGWIELRDGAVEAMLQYCPLLESLSLKKCWNLNKIEITSMNSKLKRLVVDKCSFTDVAWLHIDGSNGGPSLRFFKYWGTVGHFYIENQREMEEANLDFGAEFKNGYEEIGDLLYNILQELFSVKVLTVCSYLLQIVPHGEEPFGLRSPLNVRHLILKTALHCNEYFGIRFLLNSCPWLECFTIQMSPITTFPDYEPPFQFNPNEFWTKNLKHFKCLRRSLKVVEVKGFKGTLNEFYVLHYLLYLGRVLKNLNIYISRETNTDGGNMEEIYRQRAQKVLQFPKASENVQISIY